jgi:hypothetical protein
MAMKINIVHLAITLLTLLTVNSVAQESLNIGLYSNFAVPSREFKKAVDNSTGGMGVGFGINALFNPNGGKQYSPVFFGADFSLVTFGRDKQRGEVPFKTSFNFYHVNGVTRLFLTRKDSGFMPFIDGMLGVKVFNTRTKVDKDFFQTVILEEEEEVLHTTNSADLGYGISLGFYSRRVGDSGQGFGTFSLRVSWLWGGKSSYVKRGSVKVIESSYVEFETDYTHMSMLMIQLGINIFDQGGN